MPIDVTNKEFHYIKVVTASNIWAGYFGEKSTEVTLVARTTPQENAVGVTDAPEQIVLSSVLGDVSVNIEDGVTVYPVNVGDAKYLSISVEGAGAEDNIYINNQRIESYGMATGFIVTEDDETLVRVLVQNGDKEPVIYLLQLTGNATSDVGGIENIYVNVAGDVQEATKGNDGNYTMSVSYSVDSVGILPVTAEAYTINGAVAEASYSLSTGENVFTIMGGEQSVTLTITKASAPSTSNNFVVYVTIYGVSGSDELHIFSQDTSNFEKFLSKTAISVTTGATAWTALQTAMDSAGISYENSSGTYITEVNGLAEMDNGPLSGWLYMVNGKYPEYAMNEYTLSSGDAVVLHYTDDYTQEFASSDFSSSSSSSTTEEVLEEEVVEEAEEVLEEIVAEEIIVQVSDFVDVSEENWFFASVQYVLDSGLFSGMGDDTFAPNVEMTRGMFFSVLYRMSGEFYEQTDIWYEGSMNWAKDAGISDGTNPKANITREELLAMLWRYAGVPTVEVEEMDVLEVSPWAQDAFLWALEMGIVFGDTDGDLAPKREITRAETAAILERYMKM